MHIGNIIAIMTKVNVDLRCQATSIS